VATRLLVGGGKRITVELPGGEVEVEWAGSLHEQAPVFLTGDARKVYEGEIGTEVWT
jgi:diaminopimelate epimerase